jgi:hypothetical protein
LPEIANLTATRSATSMMDYFRIADDAGVEPVDDRFSRDIGNTTDLS